MRTTQSEEIDTENEREEEEDREQDLFSIFPLRIPICFAFSPLFFHLGGLTWFWVDRGPLPWIFLELNAFYGEDGCSWNNRGLVKQCLFTTSVFSTCQTLCTHCLPVFEPAPQGFWNTIVWEHPQLIPVSWPQTTDTQRQRGDIKTAMLIKSFYAWGVHISKVFLIINNAFYL